MMMAGQMHPPRGCGEAAATAARGILLPQGGWSSGMHPPFSFRSCPKRKRAVHGPKEKGARRAPVQWPSARDGGRRIGACSDLGLPSGTLGSSARSILPSRGGWCGGRRDARTHLTSSSFTVSRCGAPSISVTSVPLVPPSARSACPQGARLIRKRQSRQRLRSHYALPWRS